MGFPSPSNQSFSFLSLTGAPHIKTQCRPLFHLSSSQLTMATTSQAVYTGRCSRGGVINLLCETDVPYSPTRERLRSSSASSAVSSPVTPTTPQPQHWDTTPRYFSFAGSGEELRPHPCLTPPQSRGWGFNYPPPTYPARGLWPLPTPEPSPPRMAPDVCFQTCTPIPGFVRTVNEPDTAPPPVNSPQPSSTTSSPPPSPTPVARKRHSAPDTPIEDQQTTRTPVKRKKKVAAAPMVKKARKPRPKRRHYCDECEKSFTTSGHLARHKRIHSGVKVNPFAFHSKPAIVI